MIKTIKIKNIKKEHYVGDVYNLHLLSNESTRHNIDDLFWIEGSTGIVSHNCFPKDINAMIHYAKSIGCDIDIMEKCWEINKRIRTDNDWLKIEGAVS